MESHRLGQMVLLCCLTPGVAAGCASTPVAGDATPTTVFAQPIDRVHKAAIDALVVTGFDVTKQEPTYIEGARPRKVGFFVGSGGETVGIWLAEQGADNTGVRVDTARSFVGMAGQKNWNNEILNEMKKSLGQ